MVPPSTLRYNRTGTPRLLSPYPCLAPGVALSPGVGLSFLWFQGARCPGRAGVCYSVPAWLPCRFVPRCPRAGEEDAPGGSQPLSKTLTSSPSPEAPLPTGDSPMLAKCRTQPCGVPGAPACPSILFLSCPVLLRPRSHPACVRCLLSLVACPRQKNWESLGCTCHRLGCSVPVVAVGLTCHFFPRSGLCRGHVQVQDCVLQPMELGCKV